VNDIWSSSNRGAFIAVGVKPRELKPARRDDAVIDGAALPLQMMGGFEIA